MKKYIVSLFLSLILITTIFISTVLAAISFKDTGNHWAKDYIEYLTGSGAIKGYTDNTFKPDNKITRAEFTAILLRALNNDPGQPKEGKWYSYYILEAANRKYILAGEFDDVEKNITRSEMARMIVRTITEEYPADMSGYAGQLSDYGKTPDAYREFVLKAYVKGIITGRPGGIFAYAELATRAEATTMIVRMIDVEKRVMPSEPVSEDIYIKEAVSGQETKVITNHPELLEHVSKGMEILSKEGYTDPLYSTEDNHVQFFWYPNDKPAWITDALLSYNVYTEQNPDLDYYLPYKIFVYNTQNEIAYNLCKELVKDIFPEAYDKIIKELDSKAKDPGYHSQVWEKVNGREIRVFTFEGSKQINIFIGL